MKNKLIDISFYLLLILVGITIILLMIKYGGNQVNERKLKKIINEAFNTEIVQDNDIEYNGYKIIGIIKIPKINLEYPILEKTNNVSMDFSICRYWGGNVNEVGNLSLVGHNNKDGTMFGKTKMLELGDEIELMGLNDDSIKYIVYSVFNCMPEEISILEAEENIREVTLITCINGNKERHIIKARADN